MRNRALSLVLLVMAGPALAQSSTEDAMARYRAMVTVLPKPCANAVDPNEILVCARSKLRASQKVPLYRGNTQR